MGRKRAAEAATAKGAEDATAKQAKPAAGRGSRAKKAAAVADAAAAPEPKARAAAKGKGAAAGGSKPKPDFYLIKSEPDTFSIDALEGKPNQTEAWDGVRNAVARNYMQGMKVGDRCFFYHSSCKVPGIVGIAKVVREAYPDHTQFDKSSQYYDPKATQEKPRWHMVDIQLERWLARQITLEELKGHKEGALSQMALFRTARLSVQPVTAAEWEFILGLEGGGGGDGGDGGGGGKGEGEGEGDGKEGSGGSGGGGGGKGEGNGEGEGGGRKRKKK